MINKQLQKHDFLSCKPKPYYDFSDIYFEWDDYPITIIDQDLTLYD